MGRYVVVLVLIVGALGLVGAGCGGGSDSSAPATTAETTTGGAGGGETTTGGPETGDATNGKAVVEIRKLMDVEDFGEGFTPNEAIAKVKF